MASEWKQLSTTSPSTKHACLCTLCHRHLMYLVEYLAIDGMEMLLARQLSMPFCDYFVSCSSPRWQMEVHLLLPWPLWLFKDGRAMSDRAPPAWVEFIPRRPDDVATSPENQCLKIATSSYVIVSATANCNLPILLLLLVPNLKLCISRIIFLISSLPSRYNVSTTNGMCIYVLVFAKYVCSTYTLTFVYCGVNIGDGTSKWHCCTVPNMLYEEGCLT